MNSRARCSTLNPGVPLAAGFSGFQALREGDARATRIDAAAEEVRAAEALSCASAMLVSGHTPSTRRARLPRQ
jgi:hypothetical protein